jgi:hypothetical protein
VEASSFFATVVPLALIARVVAELCFTAAPRCDLIGKLSGLVRQLEKAPSLKGSASIGLAL